MLYRYDMFYNATLLYSLANPLARQKVNYGLELSRV